MEKMVACCGLDCGQCPAYIAYKNDDDELRVKTAEEWSKEYGVDIKAGDVNCAGCLSAEGPHIGHWVECEIRACSQEKGAENCAHCSDYACDKLTKFFGFVPAAKETLDGIREGL